MKFKALACLLSLALAGNGMVAQEAHKSYAQQVNTLIGTEGAGLTSGYLYPGATYPFGMVQFTPTYFAKNAGFSKIGEKEVHHQARKYGKSKFGLSRFINGYLDLISLWFLSKFGLKPMHFFGVGGSLMFLVGLIMIVVVGVNKLMAIYGNYRAPLVTESPYFYIAMLAMILGTQFFLTGFLGELISRSSQERNNYHIARQLNLSNKQ